MKSEEVDHVEYPLVKQNLRNANANKAKGERERERGEEETVHHIVMKGTQMREKE